MTKNAAIKNSEQYVFKMEKTFPDKAWFTTIIPKNVNTIIDFWCANWAFMSFLKKKFPEYNYIWIDNNYSFLYEAEKKWFRAFWSISSLMEKASTLNYRFNPNKTLLVLNSVLHEVYSYADPIKFWAEIWQLKPKYIAIRDMCAWWQTDTEKMYKIIQKDIKWNEIKEKNYREFVNNRWSLKDRDTLIHYLLKKDYLENREREVSENYLPISRNWFSEILKINWYETKITNSYILEFLRCKWIDNYSKLWYKELESLISSLETHIKIFAERND